MPISRSPPTAVASAAPAAAPATSPSLVDGGKSLMKNWFKTGADTPPAVQVYEPVEPVPSDVPLPPRRAASSDASVRMAALPAPPPRSRPPRRMRTPTRRRSNASYVALSSVGSLTEHCPALVPAVAYTHFLGISPKRGNVGRIARTCRNSSIKTKKTRFSKRVGECFARSCLYIPMFVCYLRS